MYLLFDHQYSEFIILLDRNLLNRWKNLNIYLKKKKEKERERVDYGEAWRNMKCAFFFWDKGVGGGGGGVCPIKFQSVGFSKK